jgi:hypothetical protein
MNWSARKPSEVKGKSQIIIEFQNQKPIQIAKMTIGAQPYFNIDATALFIKDKEGLTNIHFKEFMVGKKQLTFNLTRSSNGVYQINLHCPQFDLKSLLNKKFPDRLMLNSPFQIQLSIDRISYGKESFLNHFKGTLLHTGERWQSFLLLGDLVNKHRGRKGCFSAQLRQARTEHILKLRADNAGELLKIFNIHHRTKGGRLALDARKKLYSLTSPWIGHFTIENFEVVKAPVLAKLLSVVSPFGFVDLLIAGERLNFQRFRSDFKTTKNTIKLIDGCGSSTNIGLTLNGIVNRKNKTLDLSGAVIPAYVLNSFLSNIPIIGMLLDGGDGEGVLAISYTIIGSQKETKISVNPLSALAPVFLRKLLE